MAMAGSDVDEVYSYWGTGAGGGETECDAVLGEVGV